MRGIALFMMLATLVVALTVATAMAAPGSKGQGKDKVTLCHKGKTIKVRRLLRRSIPSAITIPSGRARRVRN